MAAEKKKERFVLDTSIAVKWFFKDEPARESALALLEDIARDPSNFYVPDYFFLELAAVLARKSDFQITEAGIALEEVKKLGLSIVPTLGSLLEQSLILACKTKIQLYDALFAQTSHILKATWISADARAVRSLVSSDISVKNLSDYSKSNES